MNRVSTLLFSAALLALPGAAQVKITPGPEKVAIEIDGKAFSDFYVAGATVSKPYLWPLRAATGTYVTRMWPMEEVKEEFDGNAYRWDKSKRPDHRHQRGLWFGHESVNHLDFWNNEFSYTTKNRGKITLVKLGAVKNGKKEGSIAATFDWQDIDGKNPPILREDRVMTFYADRDRRTMDLDLTLTALNGPVTFGDAKDGVLGIRIRPVLQEDLGTGHITNADGLASEKELWGKPSDWCDYSGDINGEKVGIAILDNPANPHHPVRWHARGYGLFAANPFGLAVFTGDKSQNGAITIEQGKSLRYRYRIIIHPGDVKTADIAGAWEKYSKSK
jgi:hypothetical protein